jgi:Ribbon-helix-helix protein, copG family
MKRTEVQLPDALYHRVEKMAGQLDLTVSALLRKAAEQMVRRHAKPAKPNGDWCFPESRHLGAFRATAEEWRLLANEPAE